MGYEIENYPHPLWTALICNPQSPASFQQVLAQATDNSCDALITPIFPDSHAEASKEGLSLDSCYIVSGKLTATLRRAFEKVPAQYHHPAHQPVHLEAPT